MIVAAITETICDIFWFLSDIAWKGAPNSGIRKSPLDLKSCDYAQPMLLIHEKRAHL